MIRLMGCEVKSVRADLGKRRLKVALEVYLDAAAEGAGKKLGDLALMEQPVDVSFDEVQLRLPMSGSVKLGTLPKMEAEDGAVD